MSRGTVELDFLGVEKKQINKAPNSKFKKFLDRRRSFRDIQGAISKIDPEIIKSLLANNNFSDSRSPSVPSTPKKDESQIPISPVPVTVPLTIFYNGTVSTFQVSPKKADDILRVAMETSPSNDESMKSTHLSVIPQIAPKLFGQKLEGDLPIARRKSLQRFLEKRKERLVSTSPYPTTST